MGTLIIGKESNLSRALSATLPSSTLLSARELSNDITPLDAYLADTRVLILNHFQPAVELNTLTSPADYIARAIGTTAAILEHLRKTPGALEKIIYTSSSSVYGNNTYCSENDPLIPLNLHAALKVANEELLKKFCREQGIDLTITRIFNMYGGDDRFSVISKIIDCYKNGTALTLVNDGNAIRDFIHISDVVEIYAQLASTRGIPILNIGSGVGTSIKAMLDFLKENAVNVATENITRDELRLSTANNTLLRSRFNKEHFIDVKEYLLKACKGSDSV